MYSLPKINSSKTVSKHDLSAFFKIAITIPPEIGVFVFNSIITNCSQSITKEHPSLFQHLRIVLCFVESIWKITTWCFFW